MARSRLQLVVLCILLCCITVDFERSAAVCVTHGRADGAGIWGYVAVRKGAAYLFWHYYKSPQRVSSPGKPWPTVFYAMPASSGHGNFNGIGPLDLNQQPRNSTWLHKADLLFVDTGYSYENDASGNVVRSSAPQTFSEVAADILELLKVLTRKIATLQSSPLFLLRSSYGGTYAGKISTVVAKAISAGSLNNLTVGGLVMRYGGRTTPDNAYWLSHPDYKYTVLVCVSCCT